MLNIRVERAEDRRDGCCAGKCGAAVVLNPKTGAVYVMASSPGYDPNQIESAERLREDPCDSPSAVPRLVVAPLLNRATQGLYPPGSTFKTVTAAAALDSGKFTPDSKFYDPGYCTEYGKQVSNAGSTRTAPEAFGNVNFVQAYQHSINAVFCNIGKKLGARRDARQGEEVRLLLEAADRDCRRTRARASGLYDFRDGTSSSTRRPGTRSTRAGSRSARSGCS